MRFAVPLLLLLAATVACSEPVEPELTAVVYLGDEPQTLADLQRYLDANLLVDDGDAERPPEEMHEVKSRVFDAFVDERLFLREALRRGVGVTDLEVEVYLGVGREEEETAVSASRWSEARNQLMIQKLQEYMVLDLPQIDDVEVRELLEQNRDRWAPQRRLRIRTLMLPDEEAQRVHREISRRRMTFNEAVIAHQSSEGQGVPLDVSWESLSEEVQEALEGLKAGQVSKPVEMNGDIYLFRIDAWLGDPSSDWELEQVARERLERDRRQEAFADLLQHLHREIGVTMKPENLPFEYIPEDAARGGSG